MTEWITCLYAALGVIFFGIVFNIRGKKLLFSALGGALSWASYLITYQVFETDLFGYFFAAVVMSIYAEVFARIHKAPVSVYLVAGLIPLVPGSWIYRTMEYCVMGENQLFLETGLYTLEISAVIGFAMICVSSIMRIWFVCLELLKKRRKKGRLLTKG